MLTTGGSIKKFLVLVGGAASFAINDEAVIDVVHGIGKEAGFPTACIIQIPRLTTCIPSVLKMSKEKAEEVIFSTFKHVGLAIFAFVIYSLISTGGLSLGAALVFVFKRGLMKSAFAKASKTKNKVADGNSQSKDSGKNELSDEISDEKLVALLERGAILLAKKEAAKKRRFDLAPIL